MSFWERKPKDTTSYEEAKKVVKEANPDKNEKEVEKMATRLVKTNILRPGKETN